MPVKLESRAMVGDSVVRGNISAEHQRYHHIVSVRSGRQAAAPRIPYVMQKRAGAPNECTRICERLSL